jgi:hypothetical protein
MVTQVRCVCVCVCARARVRARVCGWLRHGSSCLARKRPPTRHKLEPVLCPAPHTTRAHTTTRAHHARWAARMSSASTGSRCSRASWCPWAARWPRSSCLGATRCVALRLRPVVRVRARVTYDHGAAALARDTCPCACTRPTTIIPSTARPPSSHTHTHTHTHTHAHAHTHTHTLTHTHTHTHTNKPLHAPHAPSRAHNHRRSAAARRTTCARRPPWRATWCSSAASTTRWGLCLWTTASSRASARACGRPSTRVRGRGCGRGCGCARWRVCVRPPLCVCVLRHVLESCVSVCERVCVCVSVCAAQHHDAPARRLTTTPCCSPTRHAHTHARAPARAQRCARC